MAEMSYQRGKGGFASTAPKLFTEDHRRKYPGNASEAIKAENVRLKENAQRAAQRIKEPMAEKSKMFWELNQYKEKMHRLNQCASDYKEERDKLEMQLAEIFKYDQQEDQPQSDAEEISSNLQKEVNSLKEQLRQNEAENAKLKKNEQRAAQRIKVLTDEKSKIYRELDKYKEKIYSLYKCASDYKEERDKLEMQLTENATNSEVNTLKQQLRQKDSQILNLKQEKDSLSDKLLCTLQKDKAIINRCNAREESLRKEVVQREKVEQEKTALQEENRKLLEEKEETVEAKKELKELQKALEEEKKKTEEAKKEVKELQETLEKEKKKTEEAKKEVKELQEALEEEKIQMELTKKEMLEMTKKMEHANKNLLEKSQKFKAGQLEVTPEDVKPKKLLEKQESEAKKAKKQEEKEKKKRSFWYWP